MSFFPLLLRRSDEYLNKKGCVVEGREFSMMYFIIIDSAFIVFSIFLLFRINCFYQNFR